MNGQHRERIVSGWTQADKDMLCQLRYHYAVQGGGNIVTPIQTAYPYQPFMGSYVWAKQLGSINGPDWKKLQNYRPEQLLDGNPFARSYTRPQGWRVWDSAVCIPAALIRGNRIRKYSDIPVLRKSNSYWLKTMEPALKHAGPIGWDKKVIRPTAPFIYDLTTMNIGWDILEAAHALAHLRGETKSMLRSYARHVSQLSGHFTGIVGEIIFSLAYDLPLDTSARDNHDPGEPDFYYGIEVKSSTSFMDPILKLPFNNNEAVQPDRTLAVVEMGIYVEPHPYGFENKTDNVGPHDHWCCMPTMVTVVGWECVDVITHQPLGQDHIKDEVNVRAPPVYVMRPADLLSPELFWGYLALAKDALGNPTVDSRWRYFHEWIASPEYKQLLARTPPLVCPECMSFIPLSEKAPRRPIQLKAEHTQEEEDENKQRAADCKRAADIVNTAIAIYEGHNRYSDKRTASIERNKRKHAYLERIAQSKATRKFLELYCKQQLCGMVPAGRDMAIGILTDGQRRFYHAFEVQHGKDTVQALLENAKTNGVLNEIRKRLLHYSFH